MFGSEDGTRYRITVFLIFAIVVITICVLMLAALGRPVPEFIGGAVLGGLISQLGMAVQGYFKGREEITAAKIENEKACAEVRT